MPLGETAVTPVIVGATLSTTAEAVNTFEGLPAASVKLPAAIVKVHEPAYEAGGVHTKV